MQTGATSAELITPYNTFFERISIFQLLLYIFVSGTLLFGLHYLEEIERHLHTFPKILFGWGLVALLITTYRIEVFKQAPWRLVFIFISAFISARYLIWRTTETLIYTGPFDFLGMSLLYFAEVYALAIHFLGMFINIWPVEHKPAPLPDDPSLYPTVDIFIPTYNESIEEVVKVTVTAATRIDYPKDKIQIYILDDGSTVAKRNDPKTSSGAWQRHFRLREMANELGVNYITRERNDGAKAGNINHALKYSKGELILILDCDHVPTKDFLKNTVGWFLKDKKLFLVQTPHFFINPTPLEKNAATFSNLPGENDMFYRIIHPGLNFWNSSYFCGSAAVLKREYLEEIGGISGESITEDAETSLLLHNRGYNSVYINKPMVCGLSPETFDDYILQRTRWAQGMMQIFILNNPLLAKGLAIPQRICYFNSCFFWFFSFSRFIFYIAPATFLFFGLKVYFASVDQIILYALPHVMGAFVTMDFFYGKARKPLFSELYESVQAMFLMPAVFSVILKPRKPAFKITPKGTKLKGAFFNPLASSFISMVLINLIAVPFAVIRWIDQPIYRDIILVTGVWCIFNLLMSIISLGSFWEKKQVRTYHRINAKGAVNVFFHRLNQSAKGEIKDISLSGIGFELSIPFPVKLMEDVVLEVEDGSGNKYTFNARITKIIMKGDKTICGAGLVFDKNTYAQSVEFVYGDSQRWMDKWEESSKPVAMLRLLYDFALLGLLGIKDISISLLKAILASLKGYAEGATQRLRRVTAIR